MFSLLLHGEEACRLRWRINGRPWWLSSAADLTMLWAWTPPAPILQSHLVCLFWFATQMHSYFNWYTTTWYTPSQDVIRRALKRSLFQLCDVCKTSCNNIVLQPHRVFRVDAHDLPGVALYWQTQKWASHTADIGNCIGTWILILKHWLGLNLKLSFNPEYWMVNCNLQMANLTLDLDLSTESGNDMIGHAFAVASEFDPCLGFAFELECGERAGKLNLHFIVWSSWMFSVKLGQDLNLCLNFSFDSSLEFWISKFDSAFQKLDHEDEFEF